MDWQKVIVILIVAVAVGYSVVRTIQRVRKAKKGIVDCGCGCGADCPNCSQSCKAKKE
ncbi:MAG: FeoB-associated Cys-rich membrane protein [Bacteroidales bacterium]|nr:FeoB-associated Cys-rich membrane protein [Bacteroidales bacterium]